LLIFTKKAQQNMKIVILDGYTLNPGDLSWEELTQFGECQVYDRTPRALVVRRTIDADIILTNKTPISRKAIFQLSNLKYIGVMATGYNIVDVQAAGEKNIPVSNVPTYGTNSVAQMTFSLILELTQHTGLHADMVRKGHWSMAKDWCFWEQPLIELDGQTLGIIGYGRIGQTTGRLGIAFGMNVIAADPFVLSVGYQGVQRVDSDTVFKQSDFICLHCPLTPETEQFINSEKLDMMKKTAFLINTSRGQLVNEHDLAKALNEGRIAGAGLDVLGVEPPPPDNPLLNAKNCLITPHIAWATQSARKRLMRTVIENVKAFLNNKPQNIVNF
jgi:glycerate dehydrogenase